MQKLLHCHCQLAASLKVASRLVCRQARHSLHHPSRQWQCQQPFHHNWQQVSSCCKGSFLSESASLGVGFGFTTASEPPCFPCSYVFRPLFRLMVWAFGPPADPHQHQGHRAPHLSSDNSVMSAFGIHWITRRFTSRLPGWRST